MTLSDEQLARLREELRERYEGRSDYELGKAYLEILWDEDDDGSRLCPTNNWPRYVRGIDNDNPTHPIR